MGKLFTRRLVRVNVTHNMSHTRIYNVWKGMRRRCNNPNAPKYEYYGGKGITVCDEWNHGYGGFENFYEWAMQNGYSDDLTIDRIDSNKGYCPENCRWIPFLENVRRATKKPHKPEYTYYAYNESEKIILIFTKTKMFSDYTGLDYRRVSDGCNNSNYTYKGWKFTRKPFSEDIDESLETIPFRSTLEDELLAEVRVIHLPIKEDEDIVHTA